MRLWLSLARLEWITGPDGKPAFWKLAHMASVVLLAWVVALLAAEGALGSSVGWIFAWATLQIFASHAIKGLMLYKEGKVGATLTGQTNVSADLTAIAKEVLARRDHKGGMEASP